MTTPTNEAANQLAGLRRCLAAAIFQLGGLQDGTAQTLDYERTMARLQEADPVTADAVRRGLHEAARVARRPIWSGPPPPVGGAAGIRRASNGGPG